MIKTHDFLAYQAKISPNQPALIWGEKTWTYGEMDAIVSGMAARLAASRIKRGTHVAVVMPNRPEYVFVIHALARLQSVLVPLNVRLTSDELRWQADRADCSAVITDQSTEEKAFALLPRTWLPGTVPAEVEDTTSPSRRGSYFERRIMFSVDPPGRRPIQQLEPTLAAQGVEHPLDLNAMQAIVFTSGTTGHPKGAMLTYANHFWSATASAYRLGHWPEDRWLLALPLYHVGGMSVVLRCCLYGTAVVLLPQFDAQAVNQSLERDGATLVSLVPTMLKRLIETRRDGAPPALRCALIGGAAASPELVRLAQAQGWPLALTYGLTEACSQVATNTPAGSVRKPGSVGKPLMFTELRIDRSAPGESAGEIVLRGPTIMQGYYRDPEATAEVLKGGWLHTGDMGYLDEEGDLWIVQRRVDLIVSGGENVYPSEVEAVLYQHPAVREACVVGLPDPEWGQKVAAAIVVDAAEFQLAGLEAFLREKLAGYKRPRAIKIVAELPQSASGKVRRADVISLFGPPGSG